MTVTSVILQIQNSGSTVTDSLSGDAALMSLCNNSWLFGYGSNNASIMKVNQNLVNINTPLTVAGFVGVNTNTPQFNLDVAGNINFTGALLSNGARFYSSPWMSNSTNAYTTNNVGIGTTTPAYNLQVVGTTATTSLTTGNIFSGSTLSNTMNIGTDSNTSVINIGNANATLNLYGNFEYITSSNLSISDTYITLNNGGASGTAGGAGILISEAGSTTAYMKVSSDRNSFLFKTPNSTNAMTMNMSNNSVNFNTNALVINSNNNIGIGKTNPAYTLDINGVINASNILINSQALQAGYWLANGGTTNYSYSNVVIGSNASLTNTKLYIVNTSNNQAGTGDYTNVSSNIITYYDPSYHRFAHKSGSASIAAVYNYESNKSVYWGESTDSTGSFYSFRGRSVCINYAGTGAGGYALDVNGAVNVADKLYATNNFSLGTTNLSEKLTIASGNIALVHAGTYGGTTGTDKWMSVGDKTQTGAPQYQQSNYGLNVTWSNDGAFFGLRDYGTHKDTVLAFGSDVNSRLRFQYANSNDYMTVSPAGFVGIGNSNPGFKLDVAGNINFTGGLFQNSSAYIGSQWSNSSTAVFLLSSNVGIGKSNPLYPLDVSGTINAGAVYINGNPLSASTGGGFNASGTNTTFTTCNVGIGLSNPTYPLQVAGTVQIGSNIAGSNIIFNTIYGGSTTGLVFPPSDSTSQITSNSVTISGSAETQGNGAYTISTSDPSQFQSPYIPFQASGNISNYYQTGNVYSNSNYTGSNSTTVGASNLTAAWIQIQLPTAITLTSYNLQSYTAGTLGYSINSYVLAGTNDQVTWTSLDSRTNFTSWSNVTASNATPSFSVAGAAAYTTYRLIITKTGGYPAVINYMSLVGSVSSVTSTDILRMYSPNNTILLGKSGTNSNNNLGVFGNVSIGKSNALYPLDVVGNINFTGGLYQNGSAYIGSQWSNSSTAVFLLSSNVGIGKSNPTYPLDVVGNINFTGALYQNGSAYIGSQWSNNGTSIFIAGSNVGIGTTSTIRAFEVCGDVQFDSNIYIAKALQMPGIKIGMSSNGGVQSITTVVSSIPGYTFLNANSNVGINNTNPQYQLDVTGTSHFTNSALFSSNLTATTIYGSNANFSNMTVNTVNFVTTTETTVNTSNLVASNIVCVGNVGIGSTIPAYKLDVAGNINASGCNNTNWTGAHILQNTSTQSAPGILNLLAPNVSSNSSVAMMLGQSVTAGNCAQSTFNYFGTANTSNNLTFSFYGGVGASIIMTYAGNVGINKTTPVYPLDVVGQANAGSYGGTGLSQLNSNLPNANFTQFVSGKYASSSNSGVIKYTHTSDNSTANMVQFGVYGYNQITCTANGWVGINNTTPTYTLDVNGSTRITANYQLRIDGNTGCNALSIGGNGSLLVDAPGVGGGRFAILDGGNVGIGTTTPAYKLDVNGTMRGSNLCLGTGSNDSYNRIISALQSTMATSGQLYITVGQSATNYNQTELNFTYVGAGSSTNYGSLGLFGAPSIYWTGNSQVGIGNTNPQYKLDVSGTGHFTGNVTYDWGIVTNNTTQNTPQTGVTGGTGDRLILYPGSGSTQPLSIGTSTYTMWFSVPVNNQFVWYNSGSAVMSLSNTGTSAVLTTTGDVAAFGSVSDQRLKENVVSLKHEDCLETVSRLRPVEYDWNSKCFNDSYKGTHDVGFIAQEVEKVVPQAAKDFDFVGETYKTIKYERLVPYLVGAIKQLSEQNKLLVKRVDQLEKKCQCC